MPTGANTRVAYLHEDNGYASSPTDSTYKTFGRNAVLTEVSFDNALRRMGAPENAEATDYVATTFDGAIGVEFDVGSPWWHNHVFGAAPTSAGSGPTTYTWTVSTGEVQGARVFVGVDYGTATVERVLQGAVFPSAELRFDEGEPVRASLTGFYVNESSNTSLTPGSQPTDSEQPLVMHSGTMEIPQSTTLTRMRSATLSLNMGSRPQPDWSRHPPAAVMGAPEYTLSPEKVIQSKSQLELAYGSSGSTSPQSTVDSTAVADARIKVTTGGDTALEYDMTSLTPARYDWPNAGDPDADALEAMTFNINSVSAIATSSQSSAV